MIFQPPDRHDDVCCSQYNLAEFGITNAQVPALQRLRFVNGSVEPVSDLDLGDDVGGELARASGSDVLTLSAAQLGIWFAHRINPTSAAYNIGEYVEIRGAVNPVLFERAVRQAVAESDVLHVQFVDDPRGPRQVIGDCPDFSLPVIDVSAQPDPLAAAVAWMQADMARAIDPVRGPLFGFALFQVSDEQFFWYARYHHLVLDGFAMWLVARRVAEIYTRLCFGRSTPDGAFRSVRVLLDEEAAYRASDDFTQDRKFWLDYLADRPSVARLGDRAGTDDGGLLRRTTYLQPSSIDCLSSIAERTGTSLAHILTAATAIFLGRLTGAADVVVGLPAAVREGAARYVPGMVSNVLPLCVALDPSMTVSEAIGQTSWQIRRVLKHQRFQITDQLQITDQQRLMHGGATRGALFGLNVNIMRFNYDFNFAGHRAVAHNLSLGPVDDLSIQVYDRCDGGPLRVDFDANAARHSATNLADLEQRFLAVLHGLADLDQPLGRIDILSLEERRLVLREWNATDRGLSGGTVAELFSRQAAAR
ncbi:MAG: hypothetical protein HY056_15180, partial [Proteobacteria bacterium]|nr:hypothetical protein [Pseudomonadota bacterium]